MGMALRAIILPFFAVFASTAVFAGDDTVGVLRNDPGTAPGYVLFAPSSSQYSWLIDNFGREINSWSSDYIPGNSAYLLQDGSLIRCVNTGGGDFSAGGAGGGVERHGWDGELLWSFDYSNSEHRLHHDIATMPNGNVLMIAWEKKTREEAIAAGRDPNTVTNQGLWPDTIIEVEPTFPNGGTIVWTWSAWDHLVQEFDSSADNYGVVAEHPGKIDLNYFATMQADWLHLNAIDYNPALDQILVSCPRFREVWVIDHATTTEEAQGEAGDLLYRWGNPLAYGAGGASDGWFYAQHGAHWIKPGKPGAGDILLFNNGNGRPEGNFSTIDEFSPAVDRDGNYELPIGEPAEPSVLSWQFNPAEPFYSSFLSGADRQENGNTLICSGAWGEFFEVDAAGTERWRYVNPDIGSSMLNQGDAPPPEGPNGTANRSFRATRYAPDFAGFAGHDLTPGDRLEGGVVNGCDADFNGNGQVDGGDLGVMLSFWNALGGPADLDNSGVVDGGDLGLLLIQWGPCG